MLEMYHVSYITRLPSVAEDKTSQEKEFINAKNIIKSTPKTKASMEGSDVNNTGGNNGLTESMMIVNIKSIGSKVGVLTDFGSVNVKWVGGAMTTMDSIR